MNGAKGPGRIEAGPEDGPAAPAAVEVLVPTRNRPVELATTLAGLAAQDHPFGVVVSDQSDEAASYDTAPARSMIRVLELGGHRVRTRRHLPRRGVIEHRAALLAASTARYVLFLDDDVWLAPGTIALLHEAITELGCGMVGAAMQGLSHVDDERPAEQEPFARWDGAPLPETVHPGTPEWERWRLHNAATPIHLARRHLRPGERWLAYKVAWIAGCVLYDREALVAVGGFDFWRDVPEEAVGEDVVAEQRVMAKFGGAGILPSGAVHLESDTTIPDRPVTADGLLRA
ncbi:glycosyltransferase family 2 protein [Pseudonocardia kujensis]|uniref:glycosyltransferase n=1 Tax=Pseudonocardia kujensis TaxID=1128675 RepID=UPI001E2E4B91|nr:glycosyltransferase family A protein [Pseudonocardia kujensis]MCE0767909.1 glycosyltransferase family 2 protein [Pseudonocardia kujensis]